MNLKNTIIVTTVVGAGVVVVVKKVKREISYHMQYDTNGFDKYGFNPDGFDKNGYNKNGFDKDGFDKNGYNQLGRDRKGFDKNGYDEDGYNRSGRDKDGFDKYGFTRDGFNRNGYDRQGFGRDGFNLAGYDKKGFGRDRYNSSGKDRAGHDRYFYSSHIEELRERLERAQQQMDNKIYSYSLYDSRCVMEEAVKTLIIHFEGRDSLGENLNENVQICKHKQLFDPDSMDKLYEVKKICNKLHDFDADENSSPEQIYFVIKQLQKLLDKVDDLLVNI